jgi:hypothetical protein
VLKTWYTIKGYVAGAIALVACPCHLPITLPLLIALTAGTAFSGWLQGHIFLVGAVATVIFLGGLALAAAWVGQAPPEPVPLRTGTPRVTLLTSPTCTSCGQAREVWRKVQQEYSLTFEEVGITSARGRALAAKYNLFSTPATLIDDRVAFRGVPKPDQAAAAVRR